MKMYGGSGGTAQPLLTSAIEVSGQLHASAILPSGKQTPVPNGEEAGWTPEPIWALWKKNLAPDENWTQVPRLSSP
jgi:hypothetical protein